MTVSRWPHRTAALSTEAVLAAFAVYHRRRPAPKPSVLGAWADSATSVSVLYRWDTEEVIRGRRLVIGPGLFDSEDFVGMALSQEICEPLGNARIVTAADGTTWAGHVEAGPPSVPGAIFGAPRNR